MIETQEIQDWVTEVLAQPATLLELRSRVLERRVRTWVFASNDSAAPDANRIAIEIERSASRDGKSQNAEEVGYIVLALRSEQDGQWVNSLSFEVPGKGQRKPGDAGELEAANAIGLAAQAMRFSENLHRMMLSSAESRASDAEVQIARLHAQVSALEQRLEGAAAERMKLVLLAEELAKDDLEREMTRRRMALDEKRTAFLGEKLNDLIPIAMNRLTGGGHGKGMPVMGEQVIMRLFGSMKPEQLETAARAAGFTETQMMMLLEVYFSYAAKFEKQQEAAKRAHAERDGGGGDEPANGAAGPAAAAGPEETS